MDIARSIAHETPFLAIDQLLFCAESTVHSSALLLYVVIEQIPLPRLLRALAESYIVPNFTLPAIASIIRASTAPPKSERRHHHAVRIAIRDSAPISGH